jgi:periplasmic protein TonB
MIPAPTTALILRPPCHTEASMKPRSITLLLGQESTRSTAWLRPSLLASLLLHGVVLLWFQMPKTAPKLADLEHQQLEVVLVNADNGWEEPDNKQAKLLAQTTLQGGGDAAEGHASSPLPAQERSQDGEALFDKQQQLASLERQQNQLLLDIKRDIADLEQLAAKQSAADQKALLEKRQLLVDQLGVIENRINTLNERPRKRYIHPATREVVYARYYDMVKQRVEDVGTRHFPKDKGKPLYGHLIVSFGLNADGHLIHARVVEPSVDPTLDAQALNIIEMAMPMEKFDRRLRARADQLVIVARFDFKQDNQLQTTLRSPND